MSLLGIEGMPENEALIDLVNIARFNLSPTVVGWLMYLPADEQYEDEMFFRVKHPMMYVNTNNGHALYPFHPHKDSEDVNVRKDGVMSVAKAPENMAIFYVRAIREIDAHGDMELEVQGEKPPEQLEFSLEEEQAFEESQQHRAAGKKLN